MDPSPATTQRAAPRSEVTGKGRASVIQKITTQERMAARVWASGFKEVRGETYNTIPMKGPKTNPTRCFLEKPEWDTFSIIGLFEERVSFLI